MELKITENFKGINETDQEMAVLNRTRIDLREIQNPLLDQRDICFLLEQLKGNYIHQLMFKFALCTGIKPQEMVKIKVSDLDSSTQSVYVAGSRSILNSKSRWVGLHKSLYLELFRHCQSIGTDEYIFSGRWGQKMNWRSFYYIMEKATLPSGERLKIKRIQDSVVFSLIQNGLDHKQLAYTMGYKNWRSLRRRIQKVLDETGSRTVLFQSIFLKTA